MLADALLQTHYRRDLRFSLGVSHLDLGLPLRLAHGLAHCRSQETRRKCFILSKDVIAFLVEVLGALATPTTASLFAALIPLFFSPQSHLKNHEWKKIVN
jgi:hypothetical protein